MCVCYSRMFTLLLFICICIISSGTGTEELGQENTRRMEDTGKRPTRLVVIQLCTIFFTAGFF